MTEQATEQPTEQPTPPPTADDVKGATTREAVLKALLDKVKTAYEEARTDVQYLLDRQQETTGGRQFVAALPDGTTVGTIGLTGGEPAAVVVDAEAYIAWARAQYPTEAVTRIVRDVRPTFTTRLLGEMTAAGVPQIVDADTGEVHDVPGVAIKATRSRGHSLRFGKGGRDVVEAAWRSGDLAALVLPALAPAPAATEETGQ